MNKKEFKLSEDQETILTNYGQGFASVLATPGAGKTTIITLLIKKLIVENKIPPQAILILTLTESAAKEFKERTLALFKEEKLLYKSLPEFSTIHSFCHRNLSRYYKDYETLKLLPDTQRHEQIEKLLLDRGFTLEEVDEQGRVEINYLDLFKNSIIPIFRKDKSKFAKFKEFMKLEPRDLRVKIGNISNYHLKCLYHTPSIVEEYESFLETEKYIDFETMIGEMYNIINNEPKVLEEISQKYMFILEDESQDSNTTQSKILQMLAKYHGNYLRVGDPNQSIFTTFTGADYKNLMAFYDENQQFEIKQSNRSHQSIIDVANMIINTFPESFPSKVNIVRGATNPEEGFVKAALFNSVEEELYDITKNIERTLNNQVEPTIAILTRTNFQAYEMYERIIDKGFEAVLHGARDEDFFNNPVVKKITLLLAYALFPYKYEFLQQIFLLAEISEDTIEEWLKDDDCGYKNLKAIANNEFLYFGETEVETKIYHLCKKLYRLINSIYFPVSEVLEIINNLFIEKPEEKQAARILHQMWLRSKPGIRNLGEFYIWLKKHADSKIKQEINVEEEKEYSAPNIVHILTIHKAKGLQWDNVFMPNCSKWDFKDYSWKGIKDDRDIRTAIFSLIDEKPRADVKKLFALEEVHESRRVAYVGITRAKKNLFLSCALRGLNDKKNDTAEILELINEHLNEEKE